MEGIMVTPVARTEILLGKLIPYFVMGMGGMMMSTRFLPKASALVYPVRPVIGR